MAVNDNVGFLDPKFYCEELSMVYNHNNMLTNNFGKGSNAFIFFSPFAKFAYLKISLVDNATSSYPFPSKYTSFSSDNMPKIKEQTIVPQFEFKNTSTTLSTYSNGLALLKPSVTNGKNSIDICINPSYSSAQIVHLAGCLTFININTFICLE